eukprot:gb/GECH01012876.1/.p1 GENE.gb/GECH01012876.1/~~gb/GECH01012876.1/.p1  ORF type:complete len:231 (+),score=32.30 gb/GECH01012876.1/:1-693(+)
MNSIAYQPSYQFHTQPQTINNVNDVTPPVLTDPKYYNNFPKYSVNNSLYNCNQTFGYQVQMPSVNSIVYPTQNKNTFRSTTSRVGKKRKRNNGRFSNSKNNRIKPPKKRPRKNPNNIVGIPSYQQNVNGKVPPTLLPPVGSQPSTKPPPVANYHPYFSHNSNAYHDVQNNVCNYSYSQPSCYLPYQNNVCNHHSYSHFESPNYVYSPSIVKPVLLTLFIKDINALVVVPD